MFCSVGFPFLLGGSDLPASMGLISLESKSVDPYETRVDPCVGKEIEDLRRALKALFFHVGLAVLCTDSRFLGLYYHQFLVMLVYLLSL